VICPTISPPTDPLHTVGDMNFIYGSRIEFACHNPYRLIGVEIIYCKEDGAWTDPVPTCKEILCDTPITGDNVKTVTEGNTFWFGHIITFSCDDGMTLIGPDTRVCQSDGTWSGTISSCVKKCDDPEPPEFPSRTNQIQKYSQGYLEEVEYYCDAGYNLQGNSRIKCIQNGGSSSWDYGPPSCVRDENDHSAYELKGRPNDIINGVMNVYLWSTVVLECNVPRTVQWRGETMWYKSDGTKVTGNQSWA
uniref:CUB and sushi domain-containing protein 1-like n=1 Tax=Saccoglossus kowalevskii TaxID=10224 RepID=A0ABM0MCY5_SACKO